MPLTDVTHTPLPPLTPRSADSHKGDFGRALVVGGSRGMSGAVALAGRAALRSGAGLVTLAVPAGIQSTVAAYEASYMTHALADEVGQISRTAGDDIRRMSASVTAVALGPGLGRSAALTTLVARLYCEVTQPLVVDADALNALAECPDALARPAGPRILTPHPGEFARLAGKPYDASRRAEDAVDLAQRLNVVVEADAASGSPGLPATVVVLKGHGTVVTDGERLSIGQTGNPGMATGGSGDVLTGVITGLVCQGLAPFEAVRLGVHVHGLAGDLAAKRLGQVSLIASDLVEYLPAAFQALNITPSPRTLTHG